MRFYTQAWILRTVMLAVLWHHTWSGTTTVTLQNGVNGYTGCVDVGIADAYVPDPGDFSIYISYCVD